MNQTIWIARHGNRLDFVNPDWFNSAERPYDPPLSEDGFIQAQELGQRLKSEKIGHIFCSPFLRTVQTAAPVAEILDLPLKLEAGLSEWLNPEWMTSKPETLSLQVLKKHFPRLDLSYTSRVIPKYPETIEQLRDRTRATSITLVEEFNQDLLFVGHGASVCGATTGLTGGSPSINASLCCLVKLVRQAQSWHLELNGDTSHLSSTESRVRFN